jgi:hypothetical protein
VISEPIQVDFSSGEFADEGVEENGNAAGLLGAAPLFTESWND